MPFAPPRRYSSLGNILPFMWLIGRLLFLTTRGGGVVVRAEPTIGIDADTSLPYSPVSSLRYRRQPQPQNLLQLPPPPQQSHHRKLDQKCQGKGPLIVPQLRITADMHCDVSSGVQFIAASALGNIVQDESDVNRENGESDSDPNTTTATTTTMTMATFPQNGDWMAWDVTLPQTTLYRVSYKISYRTTDIRNGKVSLQFEAYGGRVVHGGTAATDIETTTEHSNNADTTTNSGGTSTRRPSQQSLMLSQVVILARGSQTIAIRAIDPGWTLVYMQIQFLSHRSDMPVSHPVPPTNTEQHPTTPAPVSINRPTLSPTWVIWDPTTQHPTIATTTSTTTTISSPSQHCGCGECSEHIWNTLAEGYSCGDRIIWLMNTYGWSEAQACHRVAGQEYPMLCGPACDPNQCLSAPSSSPTTPTTTTTTTTTPPPSIPNDTSATNNDSNNNDSGSTEQQSPLRANPIYNNLPLQFDTHLHCFPSYENRVRYTNVWNQFFMEVKEGEFCGPEFNHFSRDLVTLNRIRNGQDELKLEFKYLDGFWRASEVRIILPEDQMPFTYGTFQFSVKSVRHYHAGTGEMIANHLPTTLVLGLFTWDDTEDYQIRENWNHEVDIELAQWNYPRQADAQFLVQPPEDPHWYRFYSGTTEGALEQGGHTYSFLWEPDGIFWSTTAGGGRSHSYTTDQILRGGYLDRLQCLPADIEIRINLWHMYGNQLSPADMSTDHVVEVIIDHVSYKPSGSHFVRNGGPCTKDCQCASNATCRDNQCTPR